MHFNIINDNKKDMINLYLLPPTKTERESMEMNGKRKKEEVLRMSSQMKMMQGW